MADLLERSRSRFHGMPFGVEWDAKTLAKMDEVRFNSAGASMVRATPG
jgi:hypothetical protein